MKVMRWFKSLPFFGNKTKPAPDEEEVYEPLLDDDLPSLAYRDSYGVWTDLPLETEVKIDLKGNVFFKEGNKWIIQNHVTGIDFVK